MKSEPSPVHEIHNFLNSAQREIEEEYCRIQKRAAEDPGTAGDQGEENWATLLKRWLPEYFHIVTKGRILTESGFASRQIDVLVLAPSYPPILLDKKLYLAGGVVAAFECKTTLRAEDIKAAASTGAELRQNLTKREGSPYKELNSSIIYGLLAHSHVWKGEHSTPLENVERTLWEADSQHVRHPVDMMDFVCVADLATWTASKMNPVPAKNFSTPEMIAMYSLRAQTGYICQAIGGDRQTDFFSPLGVLLSGLFSKLAWTFHDMRGLEQYFRGVNMRGSGEGKTRGWDVSIYTEKTRIKILEGGVINKALFNEWAMMFI